MKIAILGCGSIGRRHLRNLQALGQTNLVAFDPVPQAREQVAAEMGINVYATTAELWQQNPDVALITAPSNLHIPLALEAVRMSTKPNALIAKLGDDLLARFKPVPLLDEYDVYEQLMTLLERRRIIRPLFA